MATNKVVYGDRTLIDLTSDSVTPSSLLEGETAHDRSGTQITGTLGDFTGATSSTAGTHGLVPAPAAGDEDKVLKGNGTWGEASSSGHTILNNQGQQVPARANLQFGKSVVTDDETNDITKVNVNNAIEKTYAEFQNMTPTERADGSVYYIPDYPTLGNVFFFRTVDAMQAAIQHGDVPNNAICITTADYPYEAKAEDVTYDNTDSGLAADNIQDAVDEVVSDLNGKQAALTNPLTQSDVVNNLTSTSANLPLSAAQGKTLNDKLTGPLSVVSWAEVIYNTGVEALNNAEKVICTKYSNGSIVISGVIHVTSAYVSASPLFTIPEGYRAQYNQAQKWVALYNTYGDHNFTCRMSGGEALYPWGARFNYDTLRDAEWVVYITY